MIDPTGIIALGLFGFTLLALGGYFTWQWWERTHPALVASTPMPDLGDDPTTDLRAKTKAFYAMNRDCSIGAVAVVMDQVMWWLTQNTVAGLSFTPAPADPAGPIVSQNSGDCKCWAAYAYTALVAAGVPAAALRFVYCQYGGVGHLMLGIVDTTQCVWVSELQNPAFVPWAAKLHDHSEIRIEKADKSAPWQVVTH